MLISPRSKVSFARLGVIFGKYVWVTCAIAFMTVSCTISSSLDETRAVIRSPMVEIACDDSVAREEDVEAAELNCKDFNRWKKKTITYTS